MRGLAAGHVLIQARRGPLALFQSIQIGSSYASQCAQQSRCGRGHFIFRIAQVRRFQPLPEHFLQQRGQPQAPGQKERHVHTRETRGKSRVILGQSLYAGMEQGHAVQQIGRVQRPVAAAAAPDSHHLGHCEDFGQQTRAAFLGIKLEKVAPGAVVWHDQQNRAGPSVAVFFQHYFKIWQKSPLPGKNQKRRGAHILSPAAGSNASHVSQSPETLSASTSWKRRWSR